MLRKRNIVESTTPPSIDSLWLNKGTAKAFVNGKWVTIAGGGTPDQKEPIIELEVGNSESVKASNLAKLQDIQSVDNLFFANIAYGYGAAKWLPTTGGEAFIVTSSGRAVIYTIGNDGSVTKASTDIDLTNPNTDLFEVVTELPTENISTSKLYCVLSSKVGEENKYTEYAYIKQTDGQFAWEKMGEFNAAPDLSGYAKLNSSPTFTKVTCIAGGGNSALNVSGQSYIEYLTVRNAIKSNSPGPGTPVFGQKGNSVNVGSEESFVFTLEDGSKVTKSIRVISTTNS